MPLLENHMQGGGSKIYVNKILGLDSVTDNSTVLEPDYARSFPLFFCAGLPPFHRCFSVLKLTSTESESESGTKFELDSTPVLEIGNSIRARLSIKVARLNSTGLDCNKLIREMELDFKKRKLEHCGYRVVLRIFMPTFNRISIKVN